MKYFLACLSIFTCMLILAVILALTVKTEYTTLIRIDTEKQYNYIIRGEEPYITFISLRDTPYDDEIKILKVKYHTSTEHLFDSTRIIGEWLGNTGIRNYPELVR